ncbi:MAG: phosphodiester glycosidase family protein [Acidimicrobiales bacterium]|nr:phosphodiester glycosidase family protein [Acidimicrobiales bacterium]
MHFLPRDRRKLLKGLVIGPAAIIGIVALFAVTSLIGALRTPGNQSFQAKWADWLRSHHAAAMANALEQYYYTHNAPPKGGQPKALNPVPTDPTTTTPNKPTRVTVVHHLPPPSDVALVVSPALPNEGKWTPTSAVVDGIPAMYEAQFRADQVYTGQITSAVWVDPTLLKVSLVPGAQEPGGTWTETPYVNPTQLPYAQAAFNGGFRMQDAHGGFYLDGKEQVPLQNGAASMVIYSDGGVDIGVWGQEVSLTPNVVAVLQNLVPLVDNGEMASNATYNDTHIWGNTLGANTVVARSGIGVTASGALLYVAGPALTARSLGESLQRAGAVRAMSLDINPEWVTFNFFQHDPAADPSQVTPSKLYPQMERPADRYLGPTRESRDFFLISSPSPSS